MLRRIVFFLFFKKNPPQRVLNGLLLPGRSAGGKEGWFLPDRF